MTNGKQQVQQVQQVQQFQVLVKYHCYLSNIISGGGLRTKIFLPK